MDMLPIKTSTIVAAAATMLACAAATCAQPVRSPRAAEPIVGLPCEGCEAVFEGLPKSGFAALNATARLASKEEPGEPMRIDGTVFDTGGRPVAGVIVYAYQTDSHGVYPHDEAMRGLAAYRHGRLRGWAKTDDEGRYHFDTIRPASYPDSDNPAHVHLHIVEVGRCTYYIDSIHFKDDPLLSPEERDRVDEGRGGSGLTLPVRDEEGTWLVRRDIRLGQGIPGYPAT